MTRPLPPPPNLFTITISGFRNADWRQVYEYSGLRSEFKTFACFYKRDGEPIQLLQTTMTHDRQKHNGKRLRIYYLVFGRSTDSPMQAVRWYNEEIKARLNGGRRHAPGSVETLKGRKGPVHRHGDVGA